LNTCLIACGPVSEVFHTESIMRTYGRSSALLDEAAKLTQNKTSGIK
jgi:manganese/zinc/iron transport system ATP- binding protein